ncbi:MAG: type II toxin-antitoxin system RelE/ParE family toxin [Fibrobacter sp.]|uniref:type II toxin-antitoxin system RelE/ParE family toxin n=1 Tax=Fibrobacter sp. TaxID=35828 RepID=UPI002A90A395|nr:type II toxin-antitoxin system RelE/ParE family toxin [Fibrobacter sp.]MDY6264099.1 type II toxin-antitoxin system RelE/ParE family toxin [Fibrobacter sp.]
MKFTVEKLPAAAAEIEALDQSQKELLNKEYETIEKQGLEYVRVRPLQKEIFEIKSNELRSLFKYKAGAIIVIGVVFVKKTQKTPKEKIKLAIKRLKEV